MDRSEFMSTINDDFQKRYVDFDLLFGNSKHEMYFDVIIRHQIRALAKPDDMSDEEYHDVMNVYKNYWTLPTVRFYTSLSDEKLKLRCEIQDAKIEIGNSIIIHTFSNHVNSDVTYRYDDDEIDKLTRENYTECVFDDSDIDDLSDEIWNMLEERLNTILCFNHHWHLRLMRRPNYYFNSDFPAYIKSYALVHFVALATKWYYTKCDISALDI